MILSSEAGLHMVGAVVIGRNEGERLRICLQSLVNKVAGVVYVDSGSTDNSLKIANALGVCVVDLDLSIPFTAARARNEGLEALMNLDPDLKYVQFVDGDCEVINSWIDVACHTLNENENVAVVCGRRRERFSERTIYNRLCDIEWDTPVGEAAACGGDALIRVSAFKQVSGYNPDMIAGEEPEMCVRLRRADWRILRIDEEMTLHDADMSRFSQWWKRTMRAGHAYAEGAFLHGKSDERFWVGQVRSNWLWGAGWLIFASLAFFWPELSCLLLVYPLQVIRIYHHSCRHRSKRDRWLFAWFCVVAKLPLMVGQLKYCFNKAFSQQSRLIEYK